LMTEGGALVKQLPAKISMGLKDTAKSYLSPDIIVYLRSLVMEWEDALRGSSSNIEEHAVEWGQYLLLRVGAWTTWFLDFLLVPFYFLFILVGLNKTWALVEDTLIPYDYREQILRISYKVHLSLSSFFRGRLFICLTIGVMAWIGLLFFGVPFAFVLGFCIGFSTIVPLLGLVFLVPAMMFYGLVGANLEQQIALLIFYALLQGLEMFVLSPFILGKEVELPPMVLVMSVLICGYLFGGIGVVLAVPIASTAKILLGEFVFPSFVELSKKDTQSPPVIRRGKRST
jgi:predicted PurR-regulated permease PerM